jgi:predicted MFS family arabinose efflux permease
MMSGFFAAAGIGRVAGALIGGPVWLAGGMQATAAASAGINLLALAALLWGLRGWQAQA